MTTELEDEKKYSYKTIFNLFLFNFWFHFPQNKQFFCNY